MSRENGLLRRIFYHRHVRLELCVFIKLRRVTFQYFPRFGLHGRIVVRFVKHAVFVLVWVSVILLEHDHDKAKRLPVLDCWFRRYIYKNLLRRGVYFHGFACGYRAVSSTTFAVPAAKVTGAAFPAPSGNNTAFSTAVAAAAAAFPPAAAAFTAAVAVAATKSSPERPWRYKSVATT
jgi:hypothetical protein